MKTNIIKKLLGHRQLVIALVFLPVVLCGRFLFIIRDSSPSITYATYSGVASSGDEPRDVCIQDVDECSCADNPHERHNVPTQEQTKALMALFDRFGDIGQTDEEIQAKRQTAHKIGSAVGDYVAENLGNGEREYSPEIRQKLSQELGGMIESFGRVLMGGPEGGERIRRTQYELMEVERKIEQQRQAEQLAVELMNIFGR